jgi:hypothetical protein
LVWDAELLETELLLELATLGLRYAGGADLPTLEPVVAGFVELPLEVLDVLLLTFVAVVLLVVLLVTVALLVPLLELGEATVDVLRLTLLLTPAPPRRELPPLEASLSDPVWYLWPLK